MGTPAFAVPSLEALIKAGHEILAAVTQPDKPRGRGMASVPCPVKEAALSHNIPVFDPPKIRDAEFIEKLKALRPDFIAVVAYGKILPQAILDIPAKGCINLHASLLPKYRGAAPINWAIINGEKETGTCTMYMDAGMDTGDVLLCEKTPINEEDTTEDLAKRLSVSGAELLRKTIGLLSENKDSIRPVPQDEKEATSAPILKKEDGRIDWNRPAASIGNLLRGLYPWPGTYTYWGGKLLKIHKGRPSSIAYDGEPGTIVDTSKESISVKCADSVFDILELQPENKKRMSAKDFIQGYRIAKGARFE